MVVCKFFLDGHCRYGHNCRFEHIYASKYSYRAPQTESNSSGPPVTQIRNNPNNAAASVFRSALLNTPQNPSFGQSQPQRVSVFDRLGPQNTFNSQAKSIFAQANQNIHSQAPSNNFFTQPRNVDAKSVFAQATQNAFIHSTPQQVFSSAARSNQRVFSNAVQSPQNIFGNAASNFFGPKVESSPGSIFKISEKPSVFGMPNNSFEQICDDDGVYSNVDQLSKEELEAFESDSFKLGFIPDIPPPKSLCV